MNEMTALITIGISVNGLLNIVWLFILAGTNRRLERIENLFINKNNLKE